MAASTSQPQKAPSREQLLYFLHEAAEIEHHLMCCYLYAAFSLKRHDPAWSDEQAKAVARWRRSVMAVALEEMTHLCLVGNLMSALGGQAHFNRPAFPVDAGPYPAGFVIRLAPFSLETIRHFMFLERPGEARLADAPGFVPAAAYRRVWSADRLSPGAQDYDTVGALYEQLRRGLALFVAEHGETQCFLGDPRRQVDASLAPLPGVTAILSLADAQRAIDTIVTQGEGAGGERQDSHFSRFSAVAAELDALLAADPSFEPAWPAATNPVMNPPPRPDGKVHIARPEVARWLDIGNAMYTTSLRCLLQGFAAGSRPLKAAWLAASFALMRSLTPVGLGLAARPAGDSGGAPHAGLTFTPLRALSVLPDDTAPAFVASRLGELVERARALPVVPVAGESASTWSDVIAVLQGQQEALATFVPAAAVAGVAAKVAAPATAAPAAVTPVPAASVSTPPAVESARGAALTILFEGRRCIHARHCVTETPTVFKANTPGDWITPDAVSAERVVEVAHRCPSGAIRYERHDGGPPEAAPPVNLLRLRENGPYALHAPLRVAGKDDGFRATLCRCGRSANKPYCDGAHAGSGFVASGEPPTRESLPLELRDGVLDVLPLRNGPLLVTGNLELCAGTGRTVVRSGMPNDTQVRLCRCGRSATKPFCDGSHVAAGFEADGA